MVRVPFPLVERERVQARPALIVGRPVGSAGRSVWTVMITGARRGTWPGDVPTGSDHASFGLPVPCYIRATKIAVLEAGAIERKLGALPDALMVQVAAKIRGILSWL